LKKRNRTGSIDDEGNVVGAKGGTEMVKEAILSRLDDNLLDEFNIIHSRVRELHPK
jgi:hypothetical protein